jgi:hypothetical protein
MSKHQLLAALFLVALTAKVTNGCSCMGASGRWMTLEERVATAEFGAFFRCGYCFFFNQIKAPLIGCSKFLLNNKLEQKELKKRIKLAKYYCFSAGEFL